MNSRLTQYPLFLVYATLAYFSWITAVSPWIQTLVSANWAEGSATLLSAEHVMVRGRCETEALYQFTANDEIYAGDRLAFWRWAVTWGSLSGSSSGQPRLLPCLLRARPPQETSCFVRSIQAVPYWGSLPSSTCSGLLPAGLSVQASIQAFP